MFGEVHPEEEGQRTLDLSCPFCPETRRRSPPVYSSLVETIAILGVGAMGEILGEGLVERGGYVSGQIRISDRRTSRLEEVGASHGFVPATSNREAAEEADILIIAVKPADVGGVLAELAQTVTRRHLVVSIAAGVKTSFIEAGLPMAGPIVRAMPNVAIRVGEAMTAIAGGERTGEPDMDKAEELFSAVGRVLRMPEHSMDAVTALSGSGPAYFAFFAEAMIKAGEELGLSQNVAGQLVIQTMRGTAELLRRGNLHAAELRQAVTSPGGTTEAALGSMQKNEVFEAVRQAVRAAAERAGELSA